MSSDAVAAIIGHLEPVPPKSMFTLDISRVLGEDFAPIANDFTRMLCIQLAIQVLMASSNGGVFTSEFFLLLLYIALGVLLYWAVVRKILQFK